MGAAKFSKFCQWMGCAVKFCGFRELQKELRFQNLPIYVGAAIEFDKINQIFGEIRKKFDKINQIFSRIQLFPRLNFEKITNFPYNIYVR